MKNTNIILLVVIVFILGVALGIGISNIRDANNITDINSTNTNQRNTNITNRVISNVNLNPDFCGSSTFGECTADTDCETAGCTGQICHVKGGKEIFSTCEARECYNDEKYGVECGCVANKCQWRNK